METYFFAMEPLKLSFRTWARTGEPASEREDFPTFFSSERRGKLFLAHFNSPTILMRGKKISLCCGRSVENKIMQMWQWDQLLQQQKGCRERERERERTGIYVCGDGRIMK